MSNDSSEQVALIAHLAEVAHAEYKRWTKGWIGVATAVVDSYEAHKNGASAASRLIGQANQFDGERLRTTIARAIRGRIVINKQDLTLDHSDFDADTDELNRAASEFAKPYIDEFESTKAELAKVTAHKDRVVSTCVDHLLSDACETHRQQLAAMQFGEFAEKLQTTPCRWCTNERIATLESDLARVKADNAALRDAAKHVVSVADSMPQLRVDPYCSWIAGAIDELRKLLAGATDAQPQPASDYGKRCPKCKLYLAIDTRNADELCWCTDDESGGAS